MILNFKYIPTISLSEDNSTSYSHIYDFKYVPTISLSEDNFWSNVLWGANHLFITEFCAVLFQRTLIKVGGH